MSYSLTDFINNIKIIFIRIIGMWNSCFHAQDYENSSDETIELEAPMVSDQEEDDNFVVEPTPEDREKYNEIYKNLSVISSLKRGEKISIYDNSIIVENSYAPSVSRWWYNQNGTSCIDFIDEQITCAIEMRKYQGIYDKIQECKTGLNNLKATYSNRQNIMDKIDIILEKIFIITIVSPPF